MSAEQVDEGAHLAHRHVPVPAEVAQELGLGQLGGGDDALGPGGAAQDRAVAAPAARPAVEPVVQGALGDAQLAGGVGLAERR